MKQVFPSFTHSLFIVSLATGIAACTSNHTSDLEAYVAEVKGQQKSSIEPIPEFEPYESFTYAANDLRDPFTQPDFAPRQHVDGKTSTSGISPDFDRPTEPLEEQPLDSLRMVGTLEQDDETWALINDTEGTIHRVQVGNYAGQNHGKITRITEFDIELVEIIPDGIGGWIERQAAISISE